MRVALVSCVKSKTSYPAPAKDLYTSTLFKLLRQYAEANADRWYILSAEHGLVDPKQVLAPYEKTLNKAGQAERLSWGRRVQERLATVLSPGDEVIILAGERYREHLVPFLKSRGHKVSIPLEGMPFGKQLQYLGAQNRSRSAATAPASGAMLIPYATRSRFFESIEAALASAGRCPDISLPVLVPLPPGGYDGAIVVDTSRDAPEGFEVDREHSDPTRFPARIRAAATVLHSRGCRGRFLITHQEGALTIADPERDEP